MQAYIAKRIVLFIPTLILVTIIIFFILRIVPGDPAMVMLGGEDSPDFSQEQLDALRAILGTDKNIFIQYGIWFKGMWTLDFGNSFYYQAANHRTEAPVWNFIKDKFPITLELTLVAVLMATFVSVPLGVISAIKQDTWGDYVARIITILGIAIPNFWLAILLILLLVTAFSWIPPLGYADLWSNPGTNLQQMVFPALALGVSNMAFIGRVTRSAMLEVFREDYIRTARAKGLAEQVVVYRHALKNALLPVVTAGGYEFGRLLAGTVIIETIFNIPGMGRLLIDAVNHRDFPLIQGIVVVLAVIVMVLNLVLDVAYAWLNPRIRYT